MATIYKVDCQNRMPLSIGVQEENLAHGIQFDITPWIEEHGAGAVTANAQRPTDAVPYPVIVQQDGNIVTWRPKTADVAIEGTGAFQLIYTVGEVVARTRIWATNIGPSLIGAGDPPDPFDDWLDDMREVAADAQQSANDSAASAQQAAQEVLNAKDEVENAEAWAVGQRGGVDVPSTDPAYENNAKYWAEQSLANQYSAFIVKSASGSIASFTDGADDVPMKSLKVAIVPEQAGSGDPSPSNVRPITGWTDADVNQTGKNIYPNETYYIGYAGGLVKNGFNYQNVIQTATGFQITTTANFGYGAYLGYFKKGVQMTWSFKQTGITDGQTFNIRRTSTNVLKNDGTTVPAVMVQRNYINGAANSITFTTDEDGYYWAGFYDATLASATLMTISDAQLEIGSSASAYEPYTGSTITAPFGSTVYGGELDVTSGVLTVNTAFETYDGSSDENWMDNGVNGVYLYLGENTHKEVVAANIYKAVPKSGTLADYTCKINTGGSSLLVKNPNALSAADFKTALASQNLQIVYELTTPTTVQLTPAEVRTLLGTNNVWSDAGAAEVEYRADPTLAYAELQALILENL